MKNRSLSPTPEILLLIALAILTTPAQARNTIKSAFLEEYPSTNGTQLTNLPSNTDHCGICHYAFGGGGERNLYGLSLENSGIDLNKKSNLSQAFRAVETLDPDSDGFTTILELTAEGYSNIPTFPGLASANVHLISGIPQSEVTPYLTPTTTVDNTPPTVAVLGPNGGESLTANSPASITWSANDESGIAGITIWESLDSGATWRKVVIGLANTGSYTWVPANRPTDHARIKVVATDGATNAAEDISDADFSIVSPGGGRVPTTLRDFDMPGSQPFEGGPELASPEDCASCHGNYDAAVEPYHNWRGSMMSLASLDPLFEANMVIANQDAPDSGDLCLRCHIPNGWLQGRSVPTDGSGMLEHDKIGVACDLCHRLVDPDYEEGVSPARDSLVLGELSFPFPDGAEYGNGMYVVDPGAIQRGPFEDVDPGHPFIFSPFHQTSEFCGTCHDVSNPVFNKDELGIYQPNPFDTRNGDFSPHSMGPVERTYSEWKASAYNSPLGVYAPEFGGNKTSVSTCQDCHMRDVSGYGANEVDNPSTVYRTDLPLHDMTGGSTWLPPLIAAAHPDKVDATAVADGVERARYMLQNAATLSTERAVGDLVVRVINETGHKLPTGYPEGRRIWVNVQFFDALDNLVGESAAYNAGTGVLTVDSEAKVYEIHPGIDSNIDEVVGLPEGPSLHFVLNNKVFTDNRIPPRGFNNAAFAEFGGQPVGYAYADGQYWDDSAYTVPAEAVRAVVNLYYQSTSKKFIEFLRDENTTNSKGQEMYDLWDQNGKCPPDLMASLEVSVLPASGDIDGDGLENLEEEAFGSDPWDAASTHRPVGHSLEIDGSAYPAIAFTRSQNLAGTQIVVEASTDLANWHIAAPGEIVEHAVVDNGDGTDSVIIRMADPILPGTRQFMRLRVE